MTATANPVSTDQARQRFRAEHKVRLVSPQEDGRGFSSLPTGVYGFSYAPATETPLFVRHSFHSFEVHKLADGTGAIIGFCTAADAAKLREKAERFDITLYPDVWQQATEPVAVPIPWLLNDLYKPQREDGNPMPLRLAPSE
jgi:hypothetical protein